MNYRSRRTVFSLAISVAILIPIAADLSRARRAQGAAVPSVIATAAPIDWVKLGQEATILLSQYVQMNTTDPPGNELGAAQMLKAKFLANGIPATVFESSPGRGIVVARLHGIRNHNKSIILLSHIDVVPADPAQWQVPPFSGVVKNGDLWGRGSLDDKGPGVIELMSMLAIKRAGILLNRDVLFVATAGEEVGGQAGAGWLVAHKRDVIADAGYLLNEGGGIVVRHNGQKLYTVSITEKTPLWLRVTASGPAGHAAVPPPHTAVARLVAALEHLEEYQSPIRVIDPVRDYYRTIATLDHGPPEDLDLVKSMRNQAFADRFLADPSQNASVRDTVTPTVLSASDKTNVISATADAEIDCRLLPGTEPTAFLAELRRVAGDDTLKWDVLLNFAPVSSPRKSLLMNAIRTVARRYDQTEVVPNMIEGFTDSHYFRQIGIVAYGFIPIEITPGEMHEVHGINERMPVKDLSNGIERMVALLEIMGGREEN
jgi:acetylornithine deacetylase/succinyl-diaminopimelate desuccinylase-like protein